MADNMYSFFNQPYSVDDYRDLSLRDVGNLVPEPISGREYTDDIQVYLGDWHPNMSSEVNAEKPYVLTMVDTTDGRAENNDQNSFDSHDLDNPDNAWNKLQRSFESQLIDAVDKHGYVEAHTSNMTDADLIFSRAVVNVKKNLGARSIMQRDNIDLQTLSQRLNDSSNTDYTLNTLLDAGGKSLRLVSNIPGTKAKLAVKNRGASQYALYESALLHSDYILKDADYVPKSGTTDYNKYAEKNRQSMLAHSDSAVVFGDPDQILDDLDHYQIADAYQIDADSLGFKTETTTENDSLDSNRSSVRDDGTNFSVNSQNAKFERATPKNMYFPPMDDEGAYHYSVYNEDEGHVSRYPAWRDSTVSDDSPVSVSEFNKALSKTLMPKKQLKRLSSVLKDDSGFSTNVSVFDLSKNKATFRRTDIMELQANGKYYVLSPSDVQHAVSMVNVLHDLNIGYDVKPDLANHRIDLKLDDSSHSTVTLLDFVHPYSHQLRTGNGMGYTQMYGHMTYHSDKHPQEDGRDANAVFATYKYLDPNDANDVKLLDDPGTVQMNSQNGGKIYYRQTNVFQRTSSRKHTDLTYGSNFKTPENMQWVLRNSDTNRVDMNISRKFSDLGVRALDAKTSERLMIATLVDSLGISTSRLPDYMKQYKHDDNGELVKDADGNLIENKNWKVFDDSSVSYESVDRFSGGSYRRQVNLGNELTGSFKDVEIVTPNRDGDDTVGNRVTTFDKFTEDNVKFDVRGTLQGESYNHDRSMTDRGVFDPNSLGDPDEFINKSYRTARLNYLKMLSGVDRHSETKEYFDAQTDFKFRLADMTKRPNADGDLVRPERPLDIKSQSYVLNAFSEGLVGAKFSDVGVDDAALIDKRKDVANSVDDLKLDDDAKASLKKRRLSAFDGLVHQMNDNFGTAPLIDHRDEINDYVELLPSKYREQYVDEVKDFKDVDIRVKQFDVLNNDMNNVILDNAKLIPSLKDIDDSEVLSEVVGSYSYQQRLNLLDEIPHDPSTDEGKLNQMAYQKAIDRYSKDYKKLMYDHPLNRKLNAMQIVAHTQEDVNSVEYRSVFASYVRDSKYATQITGDTDKANLEIQERAVKFNKDTAMSISDLLADDSNDDNLGHRLNDYLDHVRGYKLVDGDGNRIAFNQVDFTPDFKKIPVEPKIKFSFDDPKNPMPGAFAGLGTDPEHYDPDKIHLLNPISPSRFLADRLTVIKESVEKSGVKVSDRDILIDDQGMVHVNAKVPLYTVVSHEQAMHGGTLYDFEKFKQDYKARIGHHRKNDGDLYSVEDYQNDLKKYEENDHGYAQTKKGYLIEDNDDQPHFQPITFEYGQIFAPDFDGVLTTRYHRFDGTDSKSGQVSYMPSSIASFLNPEQDEYGVWSKDAMRRERDNGLANWNRIQVSGLVDILDQELRTTTNRIMATRDFGDVSKSSDSTSLNWVYRNKVATEKAPEVLLEDAPSTNRQAVLEHMLSRWKFDDSTSDATNTTSQINYMNEYEEAMEAYMNAHPDVETKIKHMTPDYDADGKVVRSQEDKIDEILDEVDLDINQQLGSSFYAYGEHNLAQTANWSQVAFAGTESGQGKANGEVMYKVANAYVLPNGRVKGSFFRYQKDLKDDAGNIIHHRGDLMKEANGKYMPKWSGTPIDRASLTNYSTKNSADRESIVKEQEAKALHLINEANIASMSLGGFTMEDAMVISEDFANKYSVPATDDDGNLLMNDDGTLKRRSLGVGDKLSDNGGNKATVSQVIPNLSSDPEIRQSQMRKLDKEHLLDIATLFDSQSKAGSPLEAVMGPMSQISRNNGATTMTYLDSHKNKFVPLVKNEAGDLVPDMVTDDAGKQVVNLLSIDDATKLAKSDDSLSFYHYVGNDEMEFKPKQFADRQNNLHNEVISSKSVQILSQRDKPMSFVRQFQDEDGNYVDHMIKDKDGNLVPDLVTTNATMNVGKLIVTDQLYDTKVTNYDIKGGKGRKSSFLVNVADASKGAYALANHHFDNGESLNKLKTGLLVMGIRMNPDTSIDFLKDSDFEAMGEKSGVTHYSVSKDDMDSMYKLLDGRSHDFVERAIKAGNDKSLEFNGIKSRENPDDPLELTSQSKAYIDSIRKFLNDSSAVANNSDSAIGYRYDAGGDFLSQLPDEGGILQLPKGVSINHMTGEPSDKLYILPSRMRINTVSTDNQPITSDMNRNYQRLGTTLAKYDVINNALLNNETLIKKGVLKTDDQKRAASQYIAQTLGLQNAVTSVERESDRITLGGSAPKNGMFKNDILGGYGGSQSVTSQVSNNAALPINVIEVSPKIAKTLGFVKNNSDAKISDASMKKHPNWDMVHVHRDPVWREQGSLGFKVRINDDINDVRISPVMASLMDGDFDGDNVGLIAMPSNKLQRDLHEKAQVDRWMMDNDGNNSLLNINADLVDNANRTNPEFIMLGNNNDTIKGRLHDPEFVKNAMENMRMEGFSLDEQRSLYKEPLTLGGPRKLKDEFLTKTKDGHDCVTNEFMESTMPVGDFMAHMVDSEVKVRYDHAESKEFMRDMIDASQHKDSSLGFDTILINVANPNMKDKENPTVELRGNFHDNNFRQKLVKTIGNEHPDLTDGLDGSNISDKDLTKLLIKHESVQNPSFNVKPDRVLSELDRDFSDSNLDELKHSLTKSATNDYQDARQKVDEISQRSFGYDTTRDLETNEVQTKRSIVSNLGSYDNQHGDGVNYLNEDTCRDSLYYYGDIKAKGKHANVDGLMGKYLDKQDNGHYIVDPNNAGYIHNPSQEKLFDLVDKVYDAKTDTFNKKAWDEFKKADGIHRLPQLAGQTALKIKTDQTGVPGAAQKKLTALLAGNLTSDLHVANAIGQPGTQKVLSIKREPIVAGRIAEMLQQPISGELLRGQFPRTSPTFMLMGDESKGRFGNNASRAMDRVAILKSYDKLVANPDLVLDEKKVTPDNLAKIGNKLGIKINTDPNDSNAKEQQAGFRETVSQAIQPFARDQLLDDLVDKHLLKDKNVEFDRKDPKLPYVDQFGHTTNAIFVESMDFIYNNEKYGMGLGVDRRDIQKLADAMSIPDDNGNIGPNSPVDSIDNMINNDHTKSPVSLMTQLGENGVKALNKLRVDQDAIEDGSFKKMVRDPNVDTYYKDTMRVFGREGSKERQMFFGNMTDSEVEKALSADHRHNGMESSYEKLQDVKKTATDQVDLSGDNEVHSDGRRRFNGLTITPDKAEELSLNDNDKVLLESKDGSRIAMNVVVRDSNESLSMNSTVYNALNAKDGLTLYRNEQDDAQTKMSSFVDEHLDSKESLAEYQVQEDPERESLEQDKVISAFYKRFAQDLRDVQALDAQQLNGQTVDDEAGDTRTSDEKDLDDQINDSMSDLDSLDNEFPFDYDAYEDDIPEPESHDNEDDIPEPESHDNEDDIPEPESHDNEDDIPEPESHDNEDDIPEPESHDNEDDIPEPESHDNEDDILESENHDNEDTSRVFDDADLDSSEKDVDGNLTSDSSTSSKDSDKNVLSDISEQRQVDIMTGDDWAPTQNGSSTVNLDVANAYLDKAMDNPKFEGSNLLSDQYAYINGSKDTYSHNNLTQALNRLNKEYEASTGDKLLNTEDNRVFVQNAYVSRMNEYPEYVSVLKNTQKTNRVLDAQRTFERGDVIKGAVKKYDGMKRFNSAMNKNKNKQPDFNKDNHGPDFA